MSPDSPGPPVPEPAERPGWWIPGQADQEAAPPEAAPAEAAPAEAAPPEATPASSSRPLWGRVTVLVRTGLLAAAFAVVLGAFVVAGHQREDSAQGSLLESAPAAPRLGSGRDLGLPRPNLFDPWTQPPPTPTVPAVPAPAVPAPAVPVSAGSGGPARVPLAAVTPTPVRKAAVPSCRGTTRGCGATAPVARRVHASSGAKQRLGVVQQLRAWTHGNGHKFPAHPPQPHPAWGPGVVPPGLRVGSSGPPKKPRLTVVWPSRTWAPTLKHPTLQSPWPRLIGHR